MMKQYTLKDTETGLYWRGNHVWSERPRVFTAAGLASSFAAYIHSPWRRQWIKDNPEPPYGRAWVSDDSFRPPRTIFNPDPVEREKVRIREAWYKKQQKDWRNYLKQHGGMLNLLPERYQLTVITIL